MTQWYAAIEKANNGYIVRSNGEYVDEDGESVDEVLVIQQLDDAIVPVTESNAKHANHLGELKAFEELVATLREHFAIGHNKYDKYYLQVRIMERSFTDGIADKQLEEE